MNLQQELHDSSIERLRLATLDRLYASLADTARRQQNSLTGFLDELLDSERAARGLRTRGMLAKFAGFPLIKTLEEFDFAAAPGVPESEVRELFSLAFIERAENVVFTGPSGVGKTHLAIALGCQAIQDGIRTRFITAADLATGMATALRDDRLDEMFERTVLGYQLLIIDEFGYLPLSLEQSELVLQVVERRCEKGSIVITSNLRFDRWERVCAQDPVMTAALLDRLLHRAHIVAMRDENCRLEA